MPCTVECFLQGQLCLKWAEMWKNLLQRPYLKLNLKVFRLSNFANPSSFDQVMEIGEKLRVASRHFMPKTGQTLIFCRCFVNKIDILS